MFVNAVGDIGAPIYTIADFNMEEYTIDVHEVKGMGICTDLQATVLSLRVSMISLSIEVVTTMAIALLSLAALKISTNITNASFAILPTSKNFRICQYCIIYGVKTISLCDVYFIDFMLVKSHFIKTKENALKPMIYMCKKIMEFDKNTGSDIAIHYS